MFMARQTERRFQSDEASQSNRIWSSQTVVRWVRVGNDLPWNPHSLGNAIRISAATCGDTLTRAWCS